MIIGFSVVFSKGNYFKALDYYNKALNLGIKLKGRKKFILFSIYNNFASLYLEMKDYSKALEYYLMSLSIAKKKHLNIMHPDIALCYNNLAFLHQDIKEYDKSLVYYEKSLFIYKNFFEKENYYTALLYNNYGQFCDNAKNYTMALKSYKKSEKIYKKIFGNKHLNLAKIYNNMGMTYSNLGNLNKALEYYNKSLNMKEEILGTEHLTTSIIYNNIHTVYYKKRNYKESYKYVKKSFDIFIKNININFYILDTKQKEKYLQGNEYKIKFLLSSSFKHPFSEDIVEQTFNDWLNYKASIFDSENSISTLYQNTKDKALKKQIEILMANQRTLANLYQNIGKDQEKWKEQIKDQEEKISELRTEIAQKSSVFQEQQGLKSIDYKAITKNLKSNELYIDYAKAGAYYYIFTLNKKEEIGFIQIDKNSTKEIDDLIMSFREDIKTLDKHRDREQQLTKSSKEKLAELYDLLIKNPLKDKLDNKTMLIISPDGALRLLPFETLYDKKRGQYLVENREIRYIPSGKELVRLYRYSKDKISKTDEVIVFANPNFDSNETALYHEKLVLTRGTNENVIIPFFTKNYKPLIGTKSEAEEINKTMSNTILFEWNRANETNLLSVKAPKILHIATHGFFINAPNISNPMLKSGIILSGANKSARRWKGYGRVTALKLSGLNLKGTDLVVLSACDTGVVDINNTDSISGLGKAFIQAGVKDVVMSLWKVDDNATKNLMVSFYKQIKEQENKKEKPNYALALKEAKIKMIGEGRHPFYWGGFVVLGL